MESANAINTESQNKVVDLKVYRNQKQKQKKQQPQLNQLLVGEHYVHQNIPMYDNTEHKLSIKILALSLENPFTSLRMYLGIDAKGAICAFNEGDEENWLPLEEQSFVDLAIKLKDEEKN